MNEVKKSVITTIIDTNENNSARLNDLMIRLQLPESKGGLGIKTVYCVDYAHKFKKDKAENLALELGLNPHATLDNIYFLRRYSTERSGMYLSLIEQYLKKESQDKALIISEWMTKSELDFSVQNNINEIMKNLEESMHAGATIVLLQDNY